MGPQSGVGVEAINHRAREAHETKNKKHAYEHSDAFQTVDGTTDCHVVSLDLIVQISRITVIQDNNL